MRYEEEFDAWMKKGECGNGNFRWSHSDTWNAAIKVFQKYLVDREYNIYSEDGELHICIPREFYDTFKPESFVGE